MNDSFCRTPLIAPVNVFPGAILMFASLQIAGCAASADGGNYDISPRLVATEILYIAVVSVRGNTLVARNIVIDGRTYVGKGKADCRAEMDFCDTARVPQECLESIWLAADDFVRSSTELREGGLPWSKDGFMPGDYLDICLEGKQSHGEYSFQWPLDREPSDPKARKLVTLLKEAGYFR